MIDPTTPKPLTPFQHVVQNILFLDADEMKALTKVRIHSIRTIGLITHEILRDLNFADVISITLLQLKAYIVYHDFKIEDSTWLALDENLWAQLPHHEFSPASAATTPTGPIPPRFPAAAAALAHLAPHHASGTPSPPYASSPRPTTIPPAQVSRTPIDYSAVDPTKVDVTGFHKGVVLHLANEASIKSFYNDIFVQGAQYNIHVTDPENISASIGTTPPGLNPRALRSTSVALYKILKKEDVISSSFTAASSIKETSTCGFQILQLLLSLVHPHLTVTSIATNPIPKYSETKDLFKYCMAIQDYVADNETFKRYFTPNEVSQMYLMNIDDPLLLKARDIALDKVQDRTVHPTTQYQVPQLAVTLTQLQKRYQPVPYTPPTIRHTHEISPDLHIAPVSTADPDIIDNLISHQNAVAHASNTRRVTAKQSSDKPASDKRPVPHPRGNYTGTCAACGGKNHHATNCYFLQKIEVVLKFLAEQPSTAKGLHKGYHSRNNPKIALARSLQHAEFIPHTYKLYDPAVFVDAMWDDVPAFIANAPEDLLTPSR